MATIDKKMTAIADPIRSLMNETEKLSLDEMADRASQIAEANENLEKTLYGTDFGGKSQYDRFWDGLQNYGNRTNYKYAFYAEGDAIGVVWTKETFKPLYDIKPSDANRMFQGMGNFDLVQQLSDLGITLDFSNSLDMCYCFMNSQLTRIGKVYLKAFGCNDVFNSCENLHTIDEVGMHMSANASVGNMFKNCTSLTNITVTGTIQKSIDFQYSPLLTIESMRSIISALKETTTTYTLTLHADAKARLSESDIAIATQKGWTIA